MTPIGLLMACRVAGLQVRVNGDKLRVQPKALATPEIVQQLRTHKRALLALLRRVDRIDNLQEICQGCGSLFVDVMGHGRCLTCVTPLNGSVA